jgi:hypothetical protein
LKIRELDDLILIWGPLSKQGLFYLQEEELRRDLRVLVPENRPFMIGLMHNIPLLKKNGIRSVYCTDNMVGFLFYKRKISELLLFCKDVREKEMTGYCGSLFALLQAKLHGVGIRVFHQDEFLIEFADTDASTLSGKKFIAPGQDHLVCRPEDERIEKDLVARDLRSSKKEAAQ